MKKSKKHPGSNIGNFDFVIRSCSKILRNLRDKHFYSPYSIHPILSQLLGLNTPLMGSGASHYSTTSVVSRLSNTSLVGDILAIPMNERRFIIDEFYEMIVPILLEDWDEYVSFVIETKYSKGLEESSNKDVGKFRDVLKKKLAITSRFINSFEYKKPYFAQLVHYGNIKDLHAEYGYLKELKRKDLNRWKNLSYPVVTELNMNNFPVENSKKRKNITGHIIFISNSTEQLLRNGKLRKRKISQAAQLAEKLGVRIIGMAGLIASFADGGHGLSEKMPGVGFTTGHAYTITNIMNILGECLKKVSGNIVQSTVAIVGAGGSIGSGCAQLVARKKPKRLLLVDSSGIVSKKKLSLTGEKVRRIYDGDKCVLSTELTDIKDADIVICATNSAYSIIKPDFLKQGAIVIDDSFPKNISKKILKEREDVIFLEGGITKLPSSIDLYTSRNMPDLLDMPITRALSCKEVYSCLAELLVLSLCNYNESYGLGFADTLLAKDIMKKAKRFGLSTAPLQCFDRVVCFDGR